MLLSAWPDVCYNRSKTMAIILDSNLELALINRARVGNAAAFGQLYDAYIKKIYDFIFYKTMQQDLAEDICSEVFMKAWKNISSFKDGSFAAWIYKIARNTIIDHYRKQKPNSNIEDYWDLEDDTDLPEEIDKNLRLGKIRQALSELKSRDREIIIMRLWLDLSFADIAQRLEQKEGAVKMSFSRAIVRLKEKVPLNLLILWPALIGALEKIYERQ